MGIYKVNINVGLEPLVLILVSTNWNRYGFSLWN
jgi:hypothetical protein